MPRPITRAPVDGKCRVCGSTDFGTRNRCKPCRARAQREAWAKNLEESRARDREKMRAWRARNPAKARAQTRRQRYALDTEDVDRLLAAQRGRCAICEKSDPDCVDHCHVTQRVRGMLCRTCNTGLGNFRDDPGLLRAAIRYLKRGR